MMAIAFSAALCLAGAAVARDGGGRGYSTNFGNVGGGGGGAAARGFNPGSSARSFSPSPAARPAPAIRAPSAAFRPPSYDGPRANYRTNFDLLRENRSANANRNWKGRQAWRGDDRRRHRNYRPYVGVTPYYGYYDGYAYDGGNCGYYYSQWRRTGNSYWRHRYEDCIG